MDVRQREFRDLQTVLAGEWSSARGRQVPEGNNSGGMGCSVADDIAYECQVFLSGHGH